MATLYMDPENGNNSNDGTSFANRVKGFNNGITAARTAPGDTIRIKSSRTGSLSGVSITAGSATVTLPSGNHKILTTCDSTTGWTFATDITGATSTLRVEGSNSIQCTPATAFTTGQFARYDLGSTVDLSAYSAIHAFIDCGSAQQTITIKLCSDAGGTVVVNTLTYDSLVALAGFHSALFKNGAALSSTVRSIVFEVSADPGTTALRIDIVAACHDPVVTPNSINPWSAFSTAQNVSDNFNTANDCTFQGIRHFLTDTTATLMGTGISGTQTNCVWPHATLTNGTIYCWHGVQNDRLEASGANAVNTIQEAGTSSAVSVYEGGYNATDMSTQDVNGMSVFVISNFTGSTIVGKSYTELSRCVFIGQAGIGASATTQFRLRNVAFVGAAAPPSAFLISDCSHENIIYAGVSVASAVNMFSGERSKITGLKITCVQPSVTLAEGLQVEDVWQSRSNTYGLTISSSSCRQGYNIRKINLKNNTTAGVRCVSVGVSCKIYDATIESATKLSVTGGCVVLQNVDGVVSGVIGAQVGVTYTRDTSTVDSGATASLRLLVNANTYSSAFPLYWELSTYNHLASVNGNACTVSMRVKKSHATDISGRLEVKRGIILAADATTDIPNDTNWNTVTVSFTPTADGPVEVYLELWSTVSTESIYIDPDSLVFTMGGVSYSIKNHKFNYGMPATDVRANYSDPGVANVLTSASYKYEANANNKTGTVTLPGVGNVKTGVTFGPGLSLTGTYDPVVPLADVKLAAETVDINPAAPAPSDPPTATDYLYAVLSGVLS
jgi:hypothetical protein